MTKKGPCILKNHKEIKLLLDGDMLVFRLVSAAKTEVCWGDTISSYIDIVAIKVTFGEQLDTLQDKVYKAFKINNKIPCKRILCFTDPNDNFRKHILPTYKANRNGKAKPLGYWPLVEWVKHTYNCFEKPSLEADDCIGILATSSPTDSIMVSGDKDFRSIPGKFFDLIHDLPYDTTEEEADYFHLYQTLIGDTTDNYKGCPGIGPVTAHKMLSISPVWETVRDAFALKGLSEEEALLQARVARILRAEDVVDLKGYIPKLWVPKE